MVILTIAGVNKIDGKSLSVDWTNKDGKRLDTTTTKPHGKSGAHFSATFTTPSVPFLLKLKGKTKKGLIFERYSRNPVHPSHVLIRVLYARNDYTVPAGGIGFVVFVVFNTGRTERFDISVKDPLKFAVPLRRHFITARKDRRNFFSVIFKAPSSAARGAHNEVLVTITGRTSKTTVGHVVSLLVV